MQRFRQLTTGLALAAAGLACLLGSSAAFAQEGGPPSPDDLKKKVLEIERLMQKAEEALVESLADVDASKRSDEAIEKLLEQKAQESTGKSAEQLRQEAEQGSAEAKETIAKLMSESRTEVSRMTTEEIRKVLEQAGGSSGSAGEGVRKMLEQIREQSKGAGEGIKWILENATQSSPHQPKQQKPNEKPDGKEKGKPEDKPQHRLEPPKSPEGKRWFAQLPPQVRKAYETQDWDSIPPRWRSILRAWTIKMASELEKGR